ncbi:hypothetical protein DPQ33_09855 [Oceanidesulfovibrio indonesiensis]|uniref:AAA+ ATPase domain-containing protein n=1 Tax=Oceanidesulfovibrio indonesiensis TaxID=54767 RepID=A0A7M3ME73_9BACT|nr:AAA family ATPase [Oceanidesulfovibrio indonesiensis]TVM17094.1 hypothetical protein DPQ33_09855 [Oceanidesulfovibrio indonesiensis]
MGKKKRRNRKTVHKATKPSVKKTSPLEIQTFGELLELDIPVREDLITPWLREGESAMIYAAAGVGKSMYSLSLALTIAGGGSYLAWTAPKPRKVLLVDGEMHMDDIKSRSTMLLEKMEDLDHDLVRQNLHIISRQGQKAEVQFPDIAKAGGRREIEELATNYDLIILDNLSTLATIKNENDAAAFTDIVKLLMRLKQCGIACILVHHSGKGNNRSTYRGSSMLATTFEVIQGLTQLPDARAANGTAFKLTWDKFRGKKDSSVMDSEIWLDEQGWHHEVASNEELDLLVETAQSGMYSTQAQIAKALNWDTSKVSRMKTKAIAEELITEQEWKDCLAQARQTAQPTAETLGFTATQ